VTRQLLRSPTFIRAAKRLLKKNPSAARALHETLTLLATDAFQPKLRTHKLTGKLHGSWACAVGYDLRIVFDFVTVAAGEAILLLTVGTHEEVY